MGAQLLQKKSSFGPVVYSGLGWAGVVDWCAHGGCLDLLGWGGAEARWGAGGRFSSKPTFALIKGGLGFRFQGFRV